MGAVDKVEVRSLLLNELQEELHKFGEPFYRAGQIAEWLYKERVKSFDEMTNLSRELRAQLANQFAFGKMDIVRVLGSHDTTRQPRAVAWALKLAGPSPQPRIVPCRSCGERSNISRYSSNDRPHGAT